MVGVIIAACLDHKRVTLNVRNAEVWRDNHLSSSAAAIDAEHWDVALMTLSMWAKVFASVARVVMASRCQPSGWLAVWSVAGSTIGINVNMKSMVARRKVGKLWRDP